MQIYELGYLILPSVPEGQLSDVVSKLKGIVAKAGGKELDGEAPFKYPLAYAMSKTIGASRYVVKDAYIGWFKFELEPASVVELKMEIDKVDEILRSILIKAPLETSFSFAKAKALIAEKEREAQELVDAEADVADEVIAPVVEVVE